MLAAGQTLDFLSEKRVTDAYKTFVLYYFLFIIIIISILEIFNQSGRYNWA